MKYNHIIYNSAQTNREGRPGFGERAVTTGMDPNLLSELHNTDIYEFSYSHPKLSTPSLAADPSLIRLIAPTYFYTVVEYGAKKAWVVGRKVAVGFDYMFYVNGNSTRLGNYVVDAYTFDSVPDRRVFEALYENPAPGSVHFIPASPEPRADNVEMSAISVGQPHDLAPEDRVFEAALLPEIDPRAVKLLFAFYKHLTEGKPVAAVIDDKDAAVVMASFMRLVPQEVMGRATFVTNFNDTGLPRGYAIACVDPENASGYLPMSWIVVNLTEPSEYASTEASQLTAEFTNALETKDMERVMNLSRWLFSNEYKAVKDLPESGREVAFRYVFEPQTLTDEVITKALSQEGAVQALAKLCAAGADTGILDKYFDKELASASLVKDIKAVIDRLLDLEKKGLSSTRKALEGAKAHIDSVVLADAASLEEMFRLSGAAGKESLAPYVSLLDMESLKGKRNAYLSSLTSPTWRKLYTLFFPTPVDEKALVRRSVTDGLPEGDRSAFLSEVVAPDRLVKVVVELMQENDEYAGALLPLLRQLQDRGITASARYFDIFKTKRDDSAFAELMINEYVKSVPLTPVEKEIERMEALCAHPTLARAVSDNKLSGVFSALKTAAATSQAEKVAVLCDRVVALPVKSRMQDEISFLATTLRGKYAGNVAKTALLGVEIGNKKVVNDQLPVLVAAPVQEEMIKKIVDFLSSQGTDRAEILGMVLEAPAKMQTPWLRVLYANEKKKRGQIIVAELQEAGVSTEEATQALALAFPEDHKAYLKSLQPSIFARVAAWVKNLFAKKSAPEKDNNPEAAAPSSPKKQKGKGPKGGKGAKSNKKQRTTAAEEKTEVKVVAAEPKEKPKVEEVAAEPKEKPKVEEVAAEPKEKPKVKTVAAEVQEKPQPEIADRTDVPEAAPNYTSKDENEEEIPLN